MHTDGSRPRCWRIRVCDSALVAHGAHPDDNGPSMACSGFQKNSSNRPGFAERFSSNMNLNFQRTSAQDVVPEWPLTTMVYRPSYFVNIASNSSRDRRSPSAVNTTDFALLTGFSIIPFSCSRFIASQSNPFHARESS